MRKRKIISRLSLSKIKKVSKMQLLDLKLDELVLILSKLHVKYIGRASFVCRSLREASDIALAGVKYVKLRSKSEKFALALIDKLKSVRTVVNDCDDSEKITQKLALRCTRIETLQGFLPQHALYYIRLLRSQGHEVRLKKLVICALKKDIRIPTIELLISELPYLNLEIAVGHSLGAQIDLNEVLSLTVLSHVTALSVKKIAYNAMGKFPRLKEIEVVMGSEEVDAIALLNFLDSSGCKMEKITLSLVSSGYLHLFEEHISSLREISFYNYDKYMSPIEQSKLDNFLHSFSSLADIQRRRKFFASFECPLDFENLPSLRRRVMNETCSSVTLLIHSKNLAVIQQVDERDSIFLKRHLFFVKFAHLSSKEIINSLKLNSRILWRDDQFFYTKREPSTQIRH